VPGTSSRDTAESLWAVLCDIYLLVDVYWSLRNSIASIVSVGTMYPEIVVPRQTASVAHPRVELYDELLGGHTFVGKKDV
jgi:hypothetical protein